DGVADQEAVKRKLAGMVSNDQYRAFGRDVFNTTGLNAEVLLINVAGNAEAVFDDVIVVAPGVVPERANGFLYFIDLLIQLGGNQSGFKKRCQAHNGSHCSGWCVLEMSGSIGSCPADQYA